ATACRRWSRGAGGRWPRMCSRKLPASTSAGSSRFLAVELREATGDPRPCPGEVGGGLGIPGNARAQPLRCTKRERDDLIGLPGDLLRDAYDLGARLRVPILH